MAEKPPLPLWVWSARFSGKTSNTPHKHTHIHTTWRSHHHSRSKIGPVLQIRTSTTRGTTEALGKVRQSGERWRPSDSNCSNHYFAVYFQEVMKLTNVSERLNTGTETGGNVCQVQLGWKMIEKCSYLWIRGEGSLINFHILSFFAGAGGRKSTTAPSSQILPFLKIAMNK